MFQTVTPWLRRNYPVSQLLWITQTSMNHILFSRGLDLFQGAASMAADSWISSVTVPSRSLARNALRLRGAHRCSPSMPQAAFACARFNTIGLSQYVIFGALSLQGRHSPLPLFLARFPAYASTSMLPWRLQGWILCPWLAVTRVGFPPTGLNGIAEPQLKHDLHCGKVKFIAKIITEPPRRSHKESKQNRIKNQYESKSGILSGIGRRRKRGSSLKDWKFKTGFITSGSDPTLDIY